MKCPAFLLAAGLSAAGVPAQEAGPIGLVRTSTSIQIDGDLSDPGWKQAAVIDRFWETDPGDNVEPKVKTVAWVTYDHRYFYLAVRCDDPEPGRIRAPYVERDKVLGTDDNVAVFLDTRNDRRSAVELRVSPRGIQADGIFNDANFNEDFAPDFFYDTAARITASGWQAELRVPFSTLRYPAADPQDWGIRIWRNYPREFRYAYYSSPRPRGSNCYVCHLHPLTGLTGLPRASSLLLVPYATGQDVARAAAPGEPLRDEATDADAGLDVKWTPGADTALDLTLNPDFSQVEADVAQIAVNERFALFFPEKRPFFQEGIDLFDTPFQAVYTRTVTHPRAGARATGKLGRSGYTVLVADDRGGGSVILPGPAGSGLAPQDFRSWVAVGRLRTDLGRSFVGLLATAREIRGGGHNRVFGPDVQWRPNQADTFTGQLLWSDTRTPDQPALASEWDGSGLAAGALQLLWDHSTRGANWSLRLREVGDDFRADVGFIPQVGYRQAQLFAGYSLWPEGFLRRVRPYLLGEYTVDRRGDVVDQRVSPAVLLLGGRNLVADVGMRFDRVRAGGRLLPRTQLGFFVQVDPARRVPRLTFIGTLGEEIDFEHARVGRGASLTLNATVRPWDRLSLEADLAQRWLDVEPAPAAARDRLFTARVQRLKATYSFSSRAFLRLIGQHVSTDNEPSLFGRPVAAREGAFSGSALFSYRLNWQTALFAGYGEERGLDPFEDLVRTDRQLFVKISYAWLR